MGLLHQGVSPIGYISSTYTLIPAGATPTSGTWYFPSTAANYIAGADFTRGIIRVNVTAAGSSGTALAVGLQSSPDGGTTWYPDAAGMTVAPGYATITAAIAAASKWEFSFTAFPGNLFRVGVLFTGGATPTLGVTGDFQKLLPDNS
jgi:hypothetical protein